MHAARVMALTTCPHLPVSHHANPPTVACAGSWGPVARVCFGAHSRIHSPLPRGPDFLASLRRAISALASHRLTGGTPVLCFFPASARLGPRRLARAFRGRRNKPSIGTISRARKLVGLLFPFSNSPNSAEPRAKCYRRRTPIAVETRHQWTASRLTTPPSAYHQSKSPRRREAVGDLVLARASSVGGEFLAGVSPLRSRFTMGLARLHYYRG
jgi:hypothetical protein